MIGRTRVLEGKDLFSLFVRLVAAAFGDSIISMFVFLYIIDGGLRSGAYVEVREIEAGAGEADGFERLYF